MRSTGAAAGAACVLLLGGCGGGALGGAGLTGGDADTTPEASRADGGDPGAATDPRAGDGGSDVGSDGAGDEPDDTVTYTWGLPGGDLSVDAIGDVFNSLVAGDCATAATDLEIFLVNDPVWTPGQEQLYRAAIAACANDLSGARTFLQDASLTRHPGDCRLYKAVVSVVEQRAQESVDCPQPEPPVAPSPEGGSVPPSADPGPSELADPAASAVASPDPAGGGSAEGAPSADEAPSPGAGP